MLLRRARPEDYPTVGALTVAAYDEFLLGPDDPYRQRLADAAARDRDAELWVATSDDGTKILGNVTICPEGSSWRELAGPGQGEFRMLAVSPDARRQGVGETLAVHALDRFRRDGAHEVLICSLAEMVGAHRIYDRLGFGRAPELDWAPLPGVSLLGFRARLGA